MASATEPTWRDTVKRVAGIAAVLALAAVVAGSDTLHAFVYKLILSAEPVIAAHPWWGALIFSLLAAVSAMLAFFSSAILVPLAIDVWGQGATIGLLWVGWWLGGLGGYAVGRWLGRPLIQAMTGGERLNRYQTISRQAPFHMILLFQLALPSEVPGYVLGTLRYRLATYLLALALAELPYALGTVYLGEFFLERRIALFLLVGTVGLAFAAACFHYLHQVLRQRESSAS